MTGETNATIPQDFILDMYKKEMGLSRSNGVFLGEILLKQDVEKTSLYRSLHNNRR